MSTLEERVREVCEQYDDGDHEADRLTEAVLRRIEWRRRRGFKICSRCGSKKPASEFGSNAARSDGLHDACLECERKRARIRRSRPTTPMQEEEPSSP